MLVWYNATVTTPRTRTVEHEGVTEQVSDPVLVWCDTPGGPTYDIAQYWTGDVASGWAGCAFNGFNGWDSVRWWATLPKPPKGDSHDE